MKRCILLFTLCLLTASVRVHAEPVDVDAARQKAVAFLQDQKTKGARRRAPAARQLRLAAQGRDATYYIFNASSDDGGYVVVSGDDATEEILGYSNTGTIDLDNMPCGMRVLLDGYADQIAFMRRSGITRDTTTNRTRKASSESFLIDEGRRTKFAQGSPFNKFVPVDGTVTGCNATAMAALLYAYQWPKATTADIPSYSSYQESTDSYYSIPQIDRGRPIDWVNIDSEYNKSSSLSSQNAVASLMRIVGVSIKTNYDTESGANAEDMPSALRNYFDYEESASFRDRNDYKNAVWYEMLREELRNNGPVVYRGFVYSTLEHLVNNIDNLFGGEPKANPGHTFLLEGYDGDYFYINWGWGDGATDKFLLDVLPDNAHYVHKQGAVFNVRPLRAELEVTGLRFNNVTHISSSPNVPSVRRASETITFNDTKLSGSITFHNKGENNSWKFFFLLLRDVEEPDTTYRAIFKSLAPDETYTYNFSFSNLTFGHHYVLSSLDLFGDEFFSSTELLCEENPAFAESDETTGNETLTCFEYWFDDDFAGRHTKTLGSRKAVLTGSLSTDHLSVGSHHLHYRVQRDDGMWSGIGTSSFQKLNKSAEARLDYWLDDDYASRVSLPIADNEDEQLLTFDLSGCAVGMHQLCYQVTLPGSQPSAIQRTAVMKMPMGNTPKLEYWFDDDIANSHTLDGKTAYAGDGYIYINGIDMTNLSVGPHRVNFRATGSGVKRSSVMTSYVMKVPVGKGNRLEYWYDDDEAHAAVLSGVSEDNCIVYDSQLNMSSLPVGLHRLNFRAVSYNGQLKSPPTTCYVLRNVIGSISRLEYWFDDDRDNVYTLSGHAAEAGEKGYIFVGELNVSGLRPGHHRLHYRGISSNGQLSTATGTASILVKLDVNGDATMASYSVSVDGNLVTQGSLAAKSEVLFSYVLDASNLDIGVHALQTTFWNSYGSSVSETTYFRVPSSVATDVNTPQPDEEDDAPIYNLSGMRVNGKAKGVFIKNGKKYVVK